METGTRDRSRKPKRERELENSKRGEFWIEIELLRGGFLKFKWDWDWNWVGWPPTLYQPMRLVGQYVHPGGR